MSPDYTEYLKKKPSMSSKWKDIALYGIIAGGIAATVLIILFVVMPYLNRTPTAREVLTASYSNLRNSKNLEIVYGIEFQSELAGNIVNLNGTASYSKTISEKWDSYELATDITDNEEFIAREEFTEIMSIILAMGTLPLEENTGELFALRPCTALRFWIPAEEAADFFDVYFDKEAFSESENVVIFMCLDETSGAPLMAFYSIYTSDAESISVMYLAEEYTSTQ